MKGILAGLATLGLVVIAATYVIVGSSVTPVGATTFDLDRVPQAESLAEQTRAENLWPEQPNIDELVLRSIADATLVEARAYGEQTLLPRVEALDHDLATSISVLSRRARPLSIGSFGITWKLPSIDSPTIATGRLVLRPDQPVAATVPIRYDLDRDVAEFLASTPEGRVWRAFDSDSFNVLQYSSDNFLVGPAAVGSSDSAGNRSLRAVQKVQELQTGRGVLPTP